MVFKIKKGFTLIELLVVVAIVAIFILIAIFAYRTQLMKGRDARRKADLKKIQNVLEDYLNDSGAYPDSFTCGKAEGTSLEGYASEVPCDPLNNRYYNYFYSSTPQKKWYKIFAKLENTDDPIIEKVGCAPPSGCGRNGNYNYWVSSPNVSTAAQQPGEDWGPPVGGAAEVTVTPTRIPTAMPTPTVTVGVTPMPTAIPTATPTPTPGPPPGGDYFGCFSGVCLPISGPEQCPAKNYMLPDCGGKCGTPEAPLNECH